MTRTVEQTQKLIHDVQNRYPDAVRLATVISLAARVEPELLRTARLKLLPEVDAGAEADLWFSPLVQAENPLAFVLFPEVEVLLRQELAQDQTLLDEAWRVLQEVHQTLPPTIRLEEEITWLALSDEPDAESRIEHLFTQVITAMVAEKRRGLAHWALRALPRLPEAARTSEAARIMAFGASARLGRRQILADDLPTDLSSPLLHWVMSTDVPTIPIGVRLLADGLEFGDASMPGAHVIEIPATHPLLAEVSWWEDLSSHTEQVIWLRGQTQAVRANFTSITIQTANGKIYALNPAQEPKKVIPVQELVSLSQALYNSGQYKDALTTFEQAIGLDPTHTSDLLYQQIKDALRPIVSIKEIESEEEAQLNKTDIAIITIRNDEYDAMFFRLKEYPPKRLISPSSERTYTIFSVPTSANKACIVALTRCAEPGSDVAQRVASDMMRDLDPQLLLIVGIASGVPHDEFTLGDVIISSRIHNFNAGTFKQNKIPLIRIHPFVSDIIASLSMYQSNLAGWNEHDSIGIARPPIDLSGIQENVYGDNEWRDNVIKSLDSHFGESANRSRRPLFKTGDIASSNSLMESTEIPTTWLKSVRSILAVEMESAGVLQAVQQMDKYYPVIAIRGISDIIGLERDPLWTSYACQSAAAFTCAFIKAGIVKPREKATPADEREVVVAASASLIQQSKEPAPLDVFIGYSSRDEKFKDELETYLVMLKRNDIIRPHYHELTSLPAGAVVGQEWKKEIGTLIEQSQIILLLISPSFLASDYYSEEIEWAMKRHQSGDARVVPIIIRSTNINNTPFEKLLALPRNLQPIDIWSNRDAVWAKIAEEIQDVCNSLRRSKK